MKKTLSVLLAVAMLLSLSVCAFADEGEPETQATEVYLEIVPAEPSAPPIDTLQEAVDAADGGTIVVTQDYVNDGGAVIDSTDGNITINLEGNKLEISDPGVGSTGTTSNGIQHIAGSGELKITSTGEDGKLTEEKGELYFESDGGDASKIIKTGIQNYDDLTLENVEISGDKNVEIMVSNNEGKVTIGEGTVITAEGNQIAFDVCWAPTWYDEGVQVTVADGAKVDGTIEFVDWGNVDPEAGCKSTLTIEDGAMMDNFVLRIYTDMESFAEDCISVENGASFTFNSDASSTAAYTVINTPDGLTAFIPAESEIVLKDGRYWVQAIVTTPSDDSSSSVSTPVYIPVEYYAPAAGATTGTVTAGNAEVVVNGESVSVTLNDTVVSAKVAPVVLADNAPAEVKVVVSHTALSGNVFEAIEMVQSLSNSLILKDAADAVIDAAQYEIVFDGYDTISIKLTPELMELLGVGTHVLTVDLGGYEIEVTVVIA